MKDQIFISYRRDDSAGTSGRLKDFLDQAFGANQVFKDVDDIPAGADFRKVIGTELMESSVVLVMIGKHYLNLKGADGKIRIFSEDDYVNIEVSTAIAFKDRKMVIPVLVDGAKMPSSHALPDNLKELAFLNAVSISHHNWKYDVQNLVDQIKKHQKMGGETPPPPPPKTNIRKPSPKPVATQKSSTVSTVLKVFGVLFILLMVLVYVVPTDDEDGTTKPPPIHNTPFNAFDGRVEASQLNVRNEPGTEGTEVKFQLRQGDLVEVTAKRALSDKDWFRIKYGDIRGWVSSDYISKAQANPSKSTDSKPVVEQQKPVEYQKTTPPPANTGPNYQSAIIGTWELVGMESNGNYLTLVEALSMQAGEPVNARELYTLNGSTISTVSYMNGIEIPNPTATYSIYGNQMSTSLGFAGTIEYLDRNEMRMRSTTTDYVNGTVQILLYYQRYQ